MIPTGVQDGVVSPVSEDKDLRDNGQNNSSQKVAFLVQCPTVSFIIIMFSPYDTMLGTHYG